MSDSTFTPLTPKDISSAAKKLPEQHTDSDGQALGSHDSSIGDRSDNNALVTWPEPLKPELLKPESLRQEQPSPKTTPQEPPPDDSINALYKSLKQLTEPNSDTEFVPLWQRVTSNHTAMAELSGAENFENSESVENIEDWEVQPFADESEAVTVEDVTVPETTAPLLNADEIEAIRKAAELDGYQEGFAKGEEHGRSSGEAAAKTEWDEKFSQQQAEQEKLFSEQLAAKQQEIDALAHIVAQLQAQAPSAIQAYEQQMQAWLLDTVTHLTQAVVSHEVKKDAEHIKQFISAGLNALPLYDSREESKDLRIYLSPDDFSRCAPTTADAPDREEPENTISDWHWSQTLRADPALSLGDCRIVTPESEVSFCLKDRLEHVCKEFLTEAKDHL